MGESKTVVVTGDVMLEFRLAQSKRRDRTDNSALFDPYNYMEVYRKPVGAFSIGNILKKVFAGLPAVCSDVPRVLAPARDDIAEIRDDDDSPLWHSYVLCEQYPKRKDAGGRDGESDLVWRVSQKLGIDRAARSTVIRKLVELEPVEDDDRAALVVVEQSQHGFGEPEQQAAWPRSLSDPCEDAWLLVEWSRPDFKKNTAFWTNISAADRFGGRIVVVVTAEDLRFAGMPVSRALSWERTVAELYDGIKSVWGDTAASPLHGCAHLVVSFETSGAVLFSKEKDHKGIKAKLVYDPTHLEKSWANGYEGSMSGFTRCLTAGVALEMIRNDFRSLNGEGVKAGIVAARHLLEHGFEAVGALRRDDTQLPRDLRFPADSIAAVLRSVLVTGLPQAESRRAIDDADAVTRQLRRTLGAAAEEAQSSSDTERLLGELRKPLDGGQAKVEALVEDLLAAGALSARAVKDAFRAALEETALDVQAVEREIQAEFDAWKRVAAPDLKRAEDKNRKDRLIEANESLIDRILRFVEPDPKAVSAAAGLQIKLVPERNLSDWRLLEDELRGDHEREVDPSTIIKHCINHVRFGRQGTPPLPTALIGKLFVTDRKELESLRAIQGLMTNYVNLADAKPLSIAVFGAPGSGKSFAITEVASQLSDQPRAVKALTFNLSQFVGPKSVSSALHQVRDVGLSGSLPLVFWDEFDTQRDSTLGWLRYFLAPMQDGEFQDGPMLHNVGRAIFVFAGGTHVSMDDFLLRTKTKLSRSTEYSEESVHAKVPDFVSRLRGFVNVQPLDYKDDYKGGVRIDAATALRRAELLRAFLRKSAPKLIESVPHKSGPGLREQLNVDVGVIAAFLRIKRFRYAARSMESIVKMSALSGKDMYDQSSLPPLEQLQLHVDAAEFLKLANGVWNDRSSWMPGSST